MDAVQPQSSVNLDIAGNPLLAIRNMDYVIVFARDMAAMRRFYADVLQFPIYRDVHPSWVEYRVGGALLVLTERGFVFSDLETPKGALSLQLAFRVTRADVDACAEVFRRMGIAIVGEPTDQRRAIAPCLSATRMAT